jgi:hypothetical protein
MRFSPAERPAPPHGLIATELELAALARRRTRRAPVELPPRFSPAEVASVDAGLFARDLARVEPALERAAAGARAPLRSARNAAASVEAGATRAS